MITETVVTTVSPEGEVHVAPMGIREVEGRVLLAPFKPSRTLDNVLAARRAVVNLTDDVRVFAGCVTGRRDWPTAPAGNAGGRRLRDTLTHRELEIDTVEDDDLRPRIWCREVDRGVHGPFAGFNRAQAAVLEAAVLVSRLHMLPAEKIESEVDYLTIAIEKTAGPREREAWTWLMAAVAAWRDGRRED
jgi:hypothetical protein